MPGSGKTTIANFIVQNTNLNKIDLDKEIEKNYNLSILNIFKNKGESYFRKIESFMLNKIINEKNKRIISFVKDSHGVSFIASPKQPQSVTLLKYAE